MAEILDEAGSPILDESGAAVLDEAGAPAPAMSTLTDDFATDDLSALWGNSFGGVTVSGGEAVLPCNADFSGLQSTIAYDLTGSFAFTQITPDIGDGSQTMLLLSPDFTNGYLIGYISGDLVAQTATGGTATTLSSIPYDPVNHAWLRISEAAGTITYATSPDGLTWTTQATSGEPEPVGELFAIIFTDTTGPAGTSFVASFNVTPAPTAAVFPLAPLDLRTELNVGGWTDISSLVYQREGTSSPVTIARGRPNEQASATPSSMSAQWNNRSGNLSPRNPTGAFYGLLGRNTPVRVSVPNPAGAALRIADDALSGAVCPGSTGLECTSDIDIRVDLDLDNYAPCLLAGQFDDAELCWSLSLNADGTVCFSWFDGAKTNQVSSTMPMPLGRVAIRCLFDPAGTSGAPQVIFSAAPTMSGSFTQLGNATPIAAEDTAVASLAAGLLIGYSAAWEESQQGAQEFGPQGRIYEVQLLNNGTLAADPQFFAQSPGAVSVPDAQGNTFALFGSAAVDDRAYRGHFECTTLPQRWDPTGADVWTPVGAKGVLQRLQQGSSPLPSAMRRFCRQTSLWTSVPGYWPAEDNAGSTQVASGLPGGLPMAISGAASFQGQAGSPEADSNFACAVSLGQVQSSTWIGSVPQANAAGSVFLLLFIPSGTPAATILSVAPMSLIYTTAAGGSLQLAQDVAAGGAETNEISGINGIPLLVQMWNQTGVGGSGGGVSVLTVVPLSGPQNISQDFCFSAGGVVPGIGGAVIVNPGGAALGSTEVGHIFTVTGTYSGPMDAPFGGPASFEPSGFAASVPPVAMVSAATAWAGETAGTRFLRLCSENSIAGRVYGYPALTAVMGAQPIDTLANLLQYGEDTDRGQVFEPAEALGLGYRTLGSLCAQAPQLTLDYAAGQLGDGSADLEPEDDDQYTINDATVERNNGSSVQVQVLTGTMSINPPPDGVGDYDTQITTYNAWDKDLPNIAGWVTSVGTADEERYPSVPLNLARAQLASQVAGIVAMRLGGYFQIQNLISQMPPGTVDQLLYGYAEGLGGYHWTIDLNGVPEDPYDVAVAGVAHAATAGSQLAEAASATAATLSVATTAGQPWTTSGSDFPFNIMIAGEEITVNDITGAGSPQTFSVTRSVNGVVKAQLVEAAVQVYPLPVAALAGNH